MVEVNGVSIHGSNDEGFYIHGGRTNRNRGKRHSNSAISGNADTVFADLTIEDFESSRIKITRNLRNASQTCRGQCLIKPVVPQIPFNPKTKNNLRESTSDLLKLNSPNP